VLIVVAHHIRIHVGRKAMASIMSRSNSFQRATGDGLCNAPAAAAELPMTVNTRYSTFPLRNAGNNPLYSSPGVLSNSFRAAPLFIFARRVLHLRRQVVV